MSKGQLFLIPSAISIGTGPNILNEQIKNAILNTSIYLAENIREARRFISSLKLGIDISSLSFEQLDKKTTPSDVLKKMRPLFLGKNIGVLSDAGCPGIADPGALAVKIAHEKGIQVVPLVGPSSIVLALMGSGLNGQSFSFVGYIPIKTNEAIQRIKELEQQSKKIHQTQIFIETPYRSDRMLLLLLKYLQPTTLLTIASDLTGNTEFILTKPVLEWRKSTHSIGKTPTVFLLLAE